MRIVIIATAVAALMSTAEAASAPKNPSPISLTPEKITELIEARNKDVVDTAKTRDNTCVMSDDACVAGFNDAIEGRQKERAALLQLKDLVIAGDKQKADRWARYYNALNIGTVALYNAMLDRFALKVTQAETIKVTDANPQKIRRQ